MIAQLPALDTCDHASLNVMDSSPRTIVPDKLFLHQVAFGHGIFSRQRKRIEYIKK